MKPKIYVFKAIARDYGCLPEQPEKENFLMQVIKCFVEDLSFKEGRLVLGGGTSLARAYKILKRFSEDADFRFIPSVSTTSTKSIRAQLTKFVKSFKGFELQEEPENDSKKIKFKLNYAKHPEFATSGVLRPHIQVEVYFADGLRYPAKRLAISSLYNEYEKLPPEAELDCVALEETAIDKISSLLWRIDSKDYHPADMRHLHDLALLKNRIKVDAKFKHILTEVYAQDIAQRRLIDGQLAERVTQVIKTLETNKKYAKNYEQYVDAVVYAADAEKLSFTQALTEFKNLMERAMLEIWKPLIYYNNDYTGIYEISSHGNIRSLPRTMTYGKGKKAFTRNYAGGELSTRMEKIYAYGREVGVYKTVRLSNNGCSNTFGVARLVLKTFGTSKVEELDGKYNVRYLDGDPANCRIDNLEWCE